MYKYKAFKWKRTIFFAYASTSTPQELRQQCISSSQYQNIYFSGQTLKASVIDCSTTVHRQIYYKNYDAT